MPSVTVITSLSWHQSVSSPGTVSPSSVEFPQDILLELAKRLDVADLLSLLSVSHYAVTDCDT
jgi:hypothetical protein